MPPQPDPNGLYQQISMEIPPDFTLILKALSHQYRLRLGTILSHYGPLSLTGIKTHLLLANSLLLSHLKKLEAAGLVQNYVEPQRWSQEYSFYELTGLGTQFTSDLAEYCASSYPDREFSVKSIPKPLEAALKSISHVMRFTLASTLIKSGPLSFSDITRLLGKYKSVVADHLKRLEAGNVIENYLERQPNSDHYSFYRITDDGKELVEGLIRSYNTFYGIKKNKAPLP